MHHNEILPCGNLSRGDATAIAAPDRIELSYDRLAGQVVNIGRALRGAGFERTDRIALVLPNGPEAATAFLSIAGACVCAPLNPAYREAELDFYLRDLRPKAIAVAEDGPATEVASRLGIDILRVTWSVTDPAGVFRLEGLSPHGSIDFAPAEFMPASPEDTALLLHTSGTTSRPKLVPLTWANLSQSADNISNTLGLCPADRCLNIMPLFHIHGLVAAVLSSLTRGASVVCTPGFVATSFFDWLDAFAPTWYTAVPTMHQSILARAASNPGALARARLRFIRSSSAALPVRVLKELESTFGVPVIEAYGMTEAAHQMASNPLPPGVRKPGSVGPSAGPKISVRYDSGQLVPDGMPGHICIAGPNVTSGYIDNPKANQDSFAGGWFDTGDLGRLDEDGYLFLSGRSKEIINRGGEKISPREVEEVLMQHSSVEQCLAFALPDSKLGEEVGAAVMLKPGGAPDEAAIQSFCSRLLADFKVPRRIYFLDEIPKGPTGKPQRIGLAEKLGIAEDGWKVAAASTAMAADPAMGARVSAIMAEVLRLSSIDAATDFFDAGGDSLLGARFLARLGDEFHCACTLVDLFRNRTPEAVAGWLSSGSAESSRADLELGKDTGAALSFGQARLWFLDQFEGGSLVYLRPYLIEIRGEIEPERVRAALVRIVERHEPLRTTIHNHEGTPQPRLRPAEPLPLEVHDWRATDASDATVIEACRQEAARPFQLDSDLLLRAGLHRLEDRRWWLLVATHHVATDGWSAEILVRELAALLRGQALTPDRLSLTYSSYARWQARYLSGERLENLLAYWRRQLDGAPAVLDLPLDFPRPSVQTFQGKVVSSTLPPDLTARLHDLSRKCGATIFMTLLAGWKSLLSRLCGATDICVVAPVAGRTRVEWEPLIGLFMNTLALRSKLDGDPTFTEVLGRVRETCLQAWSHQDLPFEKLGQALQPERSLAYTPYFQVVFQLRNFPDSPAEAGELPVRQLDIDLDTIPTDLNFEITESAQGMACRLFYNTALFTEGSAARMLEHFEVLLRSAAEAPETRLSELGLQTEGERKQVLVDWNATHVDYARDRCIHQLFAQQAARTPDAVAVQFGEQQLTYRELDRRSSQLANHLRRLGVKPDDLVAICVERSLEMVAGLLGILKSGGAYVPIDPVYPKERLGFILEDTRAAVVLTQASLRQKLGRDAGIVCLDTDWQQIAEESAEEPNVGVSAENLAYVMYTSGSTGTPKGVEIPHRGVVRLLCGTDYVRFAADEVFLQLAPLAFDASTFEIWGALLHGARLAVMAAHQPTLDEIGQAIRDYNVTTLWLTAGLFHLMVEERAADLKPLRQLVAGGDVLSTASVRRAFDELPGCRLINGYGPTESTTFACCYAVDAETGWDRSIPIGRPIANTQIYILDAHLQPVPIGVAGELCIGGDGLARGYVNRPELTAEKFIGHPFSPGARLYRTGDLARYRPDGNIEFLGRMDRQVKIRGFRIELEEIEAALQEHPGVSQCVIAARGDEAGQKRLVAYVVAADPHKAAPMAELRDFVKHKLPDYMVPAAFVMLPSLPVTPHGKIDRDALPAPDRAPASEHGYVAPRTPIEEALAEIWSEVLGLTQVGVHDNFFELGGHSLLAAQVISRVRNVTHVELSLRALFETPTIAGLAEHVHDALAGGALPTAPILPVRTEKLGLSFAQERLWFLDQLEPASAVYNVPVALRLEGSVDAALLRDALSEVVRRHETLRTRFENVHGRPVQVIEPFDELEFPVIDLSDPAEARRQCVEEAERPFDLSQPRMLRATLFRLGPTTHLLLLTMHHIASDGWSLGVLTRELGSLYQAFSAGKPSPLPELPVQYADFAVWQRNFLSGEVLETQLSYWKRHLEGAPTRLELPTDRPRPPAPSYRGATEEVIFPQELHVALKALSRQEGVTLFMTLLSAFQILLGRYSGQQDFTVGMPIAGRNRAEIEGLIGFFVNMLVLRCDLTGDPTFREFLQRSREMLLEAYAHQDLPFEKLVEELRPERNMRYGPLCQVIFAMQNTPAGPAQLGGLDLSIERVPSATAKFDLSLHMSEEANGLRALVEYSTDLFDRDTIRRMLANFGRLLGWIADRPGEMLWELDLLSSAEHVQLQAEWNATEVSYPQNQCLHELFEQQAERTPDAVAVVFGKQRLTYGELNHRANRLANHLGKLGVRRGDLVGVCVERSLEMVVGLLGILKSGAAYVPLDPAYPKERLDFILEDAQVRVVLTQERFREWAQAATADALNPSNTVGPDEPAYVIYTSGSTGQPKGVVIAHRSPVALIHWAQDVFDAGELAGVLFSTSICFDLSVFELFVPLSCGGKAILVENALHLHESPASAEVTLINTVPSVMKELLGLGPLPPLVQTVNLAGELLPADLVREIYRVPGVRKVYDLYGPSETTTYSTFALRQADGPRTIGRPIANTQIYIVDAHLNLAPIGVAGEICISGMGLAQGYLNRPELTAEKFIGHPFGPEGRIYRTGDLARYRPDGNLEFLGRMDHQVKIRGFRIELEEIEAAVKQHPDVSQCVVAAREDATGDKRLVAYVVPGDQGRAPSTAGLREFIKHKLPDYMVPAAVVLLPNLPVTPNGKIDRKALPEPDRPSALEREFVAPRTVMELQLTQIWEQILLVPHVSVNDNFFALGGHSLLTVRLIGEVLKSLGRTLPLPVFFENPTVEGMAKALQSSHGPGRPELIPLTPGGSAGSLFLFEAGIGLCRLAHLLKGGPAAFATVVPLAPGELPSLEELAAAHAALVRSQQPSGPCVLTGHSIAGLFAFEAAHQLQREGRSVELILLLDSWATPPPWWEKLKVMTVDRARNSLNFHARDLWSKLMSKDVPEPGDEVSWDDNTTVHRNAWKNYRHQPLDCRAVLFRAKDNPWPLGAIDGCMGWSGLFTRGLKIVEVPGDHFSLLEAPNLMTLAQRFQECLEQPAPERR